MTYWVEGHSFLLLDAEYFYQKVHLLYFVKWFFFLHLLNSCEFCPLSVNIMYYTLSTVKIIILHFSDKFHLVMLYFSLFAARLGCKYFVEDFCIHIHKRTWARVFISCHIRLLSGWCWPHKMSWEVFGSLLPPFKLSLLLPPLLHISVPFIARFLPRGVCILHSLHSFPTWLLPQPLHWHHSCKDPLCVLHLTKLYHFFGLILLNFSELSHMGEALLPCWHSWFSSLAPRPVFLANQQALLLF